MYQKIVIVGNLGRDPEMRYTPSGQAVTNFPVATNRRWTDNSGERHEETIWFQVSAWGKQAESCNTYLSKGAQVLVDGRLKCDPATGGPRIWINQAGEPRSSYEIDAEKVVFLSTRGDAGSDEEPF